MTDPRAIRVLDASLQQADGRCLVMVNGSPLLTPAGNPVEAGRELAVAICDELTQDGFADVTRPSLYTFFSTELDFIAPDPDRTVEALLELLAHDYLVHPDERLGRRQVQFGAWTPQIELWQRVAERAPPSAPAGGEPDVQPRDHRAFHDYLTGFTPGQLSVAIHAANLLKSATLGMLLAEQSIGATTALEAALATPRMSGGDTQDELDAQEEREADWRETIDRLLYYARLRDPNSSAG